MPLNSHPKRMIGQLNGFHQPIRRMTGYAQRGRDVFESLVVKAVDLEDLFTVDLYNVRPLFEPHLVHKHPAHVAGIVMVKRARKLVRDMSVERPA